MTITHFEDQEVEITGVYFRNNPTRQRLETYPKRMVLDGREYTFLEDGLRYLVQKGQDFINLFDVTDGQTQYRLRHDATDHWTLIGTRTA